MDKQSIQLHEVQAPNPLLDVILAPEVEKGIEAFSLGDDATVNISQEHVKNERLRNQEYLADTKQDRTQRKDYASKIYWLVVGWLIGVAGLLFLVGKKCLILSDSVLIALISGTSVNIIGLMAIVTAYLFPKDKRKYEDYQKK